ncbi:MAG: thiamine S protein [Methanolinea sp.]|nr:thiamine S protein [Methanolinea sp.]
MKCRFHLVPGDDRLEYTGKEGTTYEEALLSLGINPDTVLILHEGRSLPQDACIREDEAVVISTCSRG